MFLQVESRWFKKCSKKHFYAPIEQLVSIGQEDLTNQNIKLAFEKF
jgi:hypothetical protein